MSSSYGIPAYLANHADVGKTYCDRARIRGGRTRVQCDRDETQRDPGSTRATADDS